MALISEKVKTAFMEHGGLLYLAGAGFTALMLVGIPAMADNSRKVSSEAAAIDASSQFANARTGYRGGHEVALSVEKARDASAKPIQVPSLTQ